MKAKRFISTAFVLFAVLVLPSVAKLSEKPNANLRFSVSFPAEKSSVPLDGRLLLLVSKNNTREPRFQINEDLNTQQVFGMDVEGWKPDDEAIVDANAFGYPVRSLAEIPAGEYWV